MIKKIIGVVGTILMLSSSLMLTACGENNGNGGNTSSDDTDQESVLKQFVGISFNDITYNYDGTQKELLISGNLPNGANVVYTNNVGTNAGVYNATAKITCNGYSELNLSAKMTINKASYDVTETHWNYASPYTYDGNSKSVVLNNLPSGVSISRYINNEKVNAGTYTASAEFDYDKTNYNIPAIENCVWVINKADITGITFEGTSVLYDGNFHSIKVNGNIPDGSQISILYNNQNVTGVKDVGTYNVEVTIINPNYNTYTTSTNLVIYQNDIQKSNYDMSGVSWNYTSEFTYDGTEKSVTLNNLPDGVTVKRYVGNKNTEAGTYTASVEFNYDSENYNMPTISDLQWEIKKADITGITFENKTVKYNGEEKEILISGNVPAGASVSYTNNKANDAGTYEATVVISCKNYNTLTLTAKLVILPDLSQLSNSVVSSLLNIPDPWEFLPESFALENKVYSGANIDFANNYVNVNNIPKMGVGKQMNVVYSTLLDVEKALSNLRIFYASMNTVVNLYQDFINSNPDNYANYEAELGDFTFQILLNDKDYKMTINYKSVIIELMYTKENKQCAGRIQLTNSNVIKYEMLDNSLTIGVSIFNTAMTKLHFERNSQNLVEGYVYEFYGTETKNIKTSALIKVDKDYTTIISNKRETDDLVIEGYMEVYDNKTSNLVGAQVKETVKNI
ncbi:MAG: MBG domain-containing protein, partial [Firmicutes bacterium]|nr:MBG domain-containing protein [Bacillota bacterium]